MFKRIAILALFAVSPAAAQDYQPDGRVIEGAFRALGESVRPWWVGEGPGGAAIHDVRPRRPMGAYIEHPPLCGQGAFAVVAGRAPGEAKCIGRIRE